MYSIQTTHPATDDISVELFADAELPSFLEEVTKFNRDYYHPDVGYTFYSNNRELNWDDFYTNESYEIIGILGEPEEDDHEGPERQQVCDAADAGIFD